MKLFPPFINHRKGFGGKKASAAMHHRFQQASSAHKSERGRQNLNESSQHREGKSFPNPKHNPPIFPHFPTSLLRGGAAALSFSLWQKFSH
jgi:hypothetical protein